MKATNIPERQCIACREMRSKKELLRIVKTPEDKLLIDLGGKQNGRGAYICRKDECLNKALKSKAFERTLKMKPDEELLAAIRAIIAERGRDDAD